MSMKRNFLGAVGIALMAFGISLPVQAQNLTENELSAANTDTVAEPTVSESAALEPAVYEPTAINSPELTLGETQTAETVAAEPMTESAELVYPAEEETEVAQARRRDRAQLRANSPDFIGIGADVGTTSDVSFAVISKLSISPQFAVRPSVLVGDGFAILAPVTYEFTRYNTEVDANAQRIQIRPYAGVGASYVDNDDSSDLGMMLAAGVDVPISRQFTVNAQANYAGIFSDSDNFGVTVGLGYNFGNLIR